jgi:hypothetical protein
VFLKTAVDEYVSAERYLSVDRCFSIEAVVIRLARDSGSIGKAQW